MAQETPAEVELKQSLQKSLTLLVKQQQTITRLQKTIIYLQHNLLDASDDLFLLQDHMRSYDSVATDKAIVQYKQIAREEIS